MALRIKTSEDFYQHLPDGTVVITEDIIFEAPGDATYPTKPIMVEGKTFKKSVRISAPWCGRFQFNNCFFTTFEAAGDYKLEDLSFNKCTFDSINIGGRISVHALFITKSNKSGNIVVGPGVSGHYFNIYDNPRIRKFQFAGKIDHLRLVNRRKNTTKDKPTDRPLKYLSHQSIGSVTLNVSQMGSIVVEFIKTQELRVHEANIDGSTRFNHIYAAKLVFQEFASSNTTLSKVDVEYDANGKFELYATDLNGVRFHDCKLAGQTFIKSSRVAGATTLDSDWPLELEGTGETKHTAYQQLRLLHQSHGSYRKQLHYLKLEMSSFKELEDKELIRERKESKGFWAKCKWLSHWFEHLIKVRLPHFASRFATLTGRPIVIFFIGWLVITNLFILMQGNELGIVHAWTWPWHWDVNLFFHIALPTHRGLYHGDILLEWIDIPWKIISAYLIYHIVVSSRKLIKA